MSNKIILPVSGSQSLRYPAKGQLWAQTLIGRAPAASPRSSFFAEDLWELSNTLDNISKTALVIFTTTKGLVSIRNLSPIASISVSFEKYLPTKEILYRGELFITDQTLYRNLTIRVGHVALRVASYGGIGKDMKIMSIQRTS